MSNIGKTKRVAWGITGSGDKLEEIFRVMEDIVEIYDDVDVRVYMSKAGEQVVKMYNLSYLLEENFYKVWVERNANLPFLAGELQMGRYDFLLIAPATSNTVAKVSMSLADSMLSNAAIMALKAFVPVYILPSDLRTGTVTTKLPSGKDLKLRIREEDVENVRKLEKIDDVFILKEPNDINMVFEEHYSPDRTTPLNIPRELYVKLNKIAQEKGVPPEEIASEILKENLD